jgi:hypothetical protein
MTPEEAVRALAAIRRRVDVVATTMAMAIRMVGQAITPLKDVR